MGGGVDITNVGKAALMQSRPVMEINHPLIEGRIRLLEESLRHVHDSMGALQAAAYMEVLSRTFRDLLAGIQAQLPQRLETSPCWATRQLAKEFTAEGDSVYKRLPEMIYIWLPVMAIAVHFMLEDLVSGVEFPYANDLQRRVAHILIAIETGIYHEYCT